MSVAAPLPPGKLPPDLLASLLRRRGAPDPRVRLGPGVGLDAAVVRLGAVDLVLKSDPVTFTADEIGWYAVNVNANDVAVMGARPAWFQATVIVPEGTRPAAVRRIFADVDRAARRLGIAVTGGHTEVSPAVSRPVLAGDMQGIVPHGRLVTPRGARLGDALLLTGWAGVEGTSIIARSFPAESRAVLGAARHRRAARFHHDPGISVVRAALGAARLGATAMHDPTEGGVAAALYELAAAAGRRLAVDLDAVPVHPSTALLCARFGLRPLGLLGSGALLITAPPRRVAGLLRSLQGIRVPAVVIGSVAAGRGVLARRGGRRARFEWSQRDELTRLFGAG